MRSMTGFGASFVNNDNLCIQLEIKSVNGKFLEITTNMPRTYSGFENVVQSVIKENLSRGNVECRVKVSQITGESDYDINLDESLAEKVCLAGFALSKRFGLPCEMNATDLLKINEVMKIVPRIAEFNEETSALFEKATQDAVYNLLEMSKIEGENLQRDLTSKINSLEEVVKNIEKQVPLAVDEYKQKLTKRIQEALGEVEIDEAKLLNEVAFFVDKYDISEEVVRLNSHIAQFKKLIVADLPCGKQLEFLTQELTREVNTTGSKASSVNISNLVIEAKNIVESIKEQIRNVE